MNQGTVMFTTGTVTHRISAAMMKLARVVERAFPCLKTHTKLLLLTLDDYFCQPLNSIGLSFGFPLTLAFGVRSQPRSR